MFWSRFYWGASRIQDKDNNLPDHFKTSFKDRFQLKQIDWLMFQKSWQLWWSLFFENFILKNLSYLLLKAVLCSVHPCMSAANVGNKPISLQRNYGVSMVNIKCSASVWQLDIGGWISFGCYCFIASQLVVTFWKLTPVQEKESLMCRV
jgi:hypothetical protein